MTNLRMCCDLFTMMVLSTVTLLIVISCSCSEAKSSSTIVVGSVYCDTCSHHYLSKSSHVISGAMVAVECRAGGSNNNFTRSVSQTNEKGEFQTHLPFSPRKHAKRINSCSVKLIHSGHPNCTIPSAGSPNVLVLKSTKNGVRTFSAGAFSFKPINVPIISCSQKKKKSEENFINSVNLQKESDVNPPVPDHLPVLSSPDLFPSTPLQQSTPPLISLNIPPLLNLPPLMNIPIPLPSFKPVPGFGFPGIPSRSSLSKDDENSP